MCDPSDITFGSENNAFWLAGSTEENTARRNDVCQICAAPPLEDHGDQSGDKDPQRDAAGHHEPQ